MKSKRQNPPLPKMVVSACERDLVSSLIGVKFDLLSYLGTSTVEYVA